MKMTSLNRNIVILMAEDDDDDRKSMTEVCEELNLEIDIRFVVDGIDLMDYLQHRGEYEDSDSFPQPDLILLDLNMPRKNGYQVLKEIRSDDVFRCIPIVVFSTSNDEAEIAKARGLGANAFFSKPASFDELTQIVTGLQEFWVKPG